MLKKKNKIVIRKPLRQKFSGRSLLVYKSKKDVGQVRDSIQGWVSPAIAESKISDFLILYEGKKTETEILSRKYDVRLTEVASYGQMHLHKAPNLLIEGENFAVLRTLLDDKSIAGRVREIYIDPPFSTRQEFRIGKSRTSTISSSNCDPIAYEDKLTGAQFLKFLRERLILLRELLADDGSIYLHIDYKIGHYVKIIMDEIFGPENFINDITHIKCNPKNFSRKGYGNIKDMILFYSRTSNFVWNEPREEMTN